MYKTKVTTVNINDNSPLTFKINVQQINPLTFFNFKQFNF